MTIFDKYLREACDSKTIVSIYSDMRRRTTFNSGYIMQCDDVSYTMAVIDEYGNSNGVMCKPISDIIRLESQTRFLKRIKYLSDKKSGYLPRAKIPADVVLNQDGILKLAHAENSLVSISIEESSTIYGFIKSINVDSLCLDVIDFFGCEDGLSIVPMSQINSVGMNGIELDKVLLLWERVHVDKINIYEPCSPPSLPPSNPPQIPDELP